MLYLLCALLGAVAMVLAAAGGKCTQDAYGRKGILLDEYGGIRFRLPPMATIGGANCDVDLSGCGYPIRPNEVLARIRLDREGRFILTGWVTVLRGAASIPGTEQGISLVHNDVILLPWRDRCIRITFQRR